MAFPIFDTAPPKVCSECGGTESVINPARGKPMWYRNKIKGRGFWCKNCYEKIYRRCLKQEAK